MKSTMKQEVFSSCQVFKGWWLLGKLADGAPLEYKRFTPLSTHFPFSRYTSPKE